MTEAQNKEIVLAAYQACFGDQDLSAIEKYFDANFIEHNPQFTDGHKGVKDAIAQFSKGPKKTIDIRRVAADGDLVWVHVKFPDPDNEGKFFAIADIFRVANGKIVEHWDVIQPVDEKDSKNDHPFF